MHPYSPSSSMNTVSVSGRVPMEFSMSKYCVISSKSTTSFDEAPLICSFDVKSLMEFLRPSTIAFLWRATPTPVWQSSVVERLRRQHRPYHILYIGPDLQLVAF